MSTKHDECCSLEEVFEAMIAKNWKNCWWPNNQKFAHNLFVPSFIFPSLLFIYLLSNAVYSNIDRTFGTKLLPIMKSAVCPFIYLFVSLLFLLRVQSMKSIYIKRRNGGSPILEEQEEIFVFSLKYLVLLLLF